MFLGFGSPSAKIQIFADFTPSAVAQITFSPPYQLRNSIAASPSNMFFFSGENVIVFPVGKIPSPFSTVNVSSISFEIGFPS